MKKILLPLFLAASGCYPTSAKIVKTPDKNEYSQLRDTITRDRGFCSSLSDVEKGQSNIRGCLTPTGAALIIKFR